MSAEHDELVDSQRQWRFWDYLWRGGLIAFTLFVIGASLLTFWYAADYQSQKRNLEEEVANVRAAQEPLEIAELEAYYRLPPDVEDLTPEYFDALACFKIAANKRVSEEELSALPRVGIGEWPAFSTDSQAQAMADKFLERSRPTLDKLRALAKRPGDVRYPIKFADHIGAYPEHIIPMMAAADHLRLDFDLHLARGDRNRALDDLLAAIRLGETLHYEPLERSQSMRMAHFGVNGDCISRFLADDKTTEDEILALQKAIADLDFEDGMIRQLLGERVLWYEALRTADPKVLSDLFEDKFPRFAPVIKTRPGDVAALLAWQSELIQAARQPYPVAIADMELKEHPADRHMQNAIRWRTSFLNIFSEHTGPRWMARGIALQRTLQIVLAIELMRVRTGRRPAKLSDLAPDDLQSTPEDPFTGRLPIYVIYDEDYLVYSCGQNRKDDGGLFEAKSMDMGDLGFKIRIRPPDPPE